MDKVGQQRASPGLGPCRLWSPQGRKRALREVLTQELEQVWVVVHGCDALPVRPVFPPHLPDLLRGIIASQDPSHCRLTPSFREVKVERGVQAGFKVGGWRTRL